MKVALKKTQHYYISATLLTTVKLMYLGTDTENTQHYNTCFTLLTTVKLSCLDTSTENTQHYNTSGTLLTTLKITYNGNNGILTLAFRTLNTKTLVLHYLLM